MVDAGFCKAGSDNLPAVDPEMVASFFSNNTDFVSAEISGVKATRATRQSYGDDAVGFVQVKRVGDLCTVKARITPEHKVRNPDYRVEVIINETNSTIETAQCMGCVARSGGCKHVVAFIFWLHRKSMEPSVTSQVSYWKASKLSKSMRDRTYVKASELGNKAPVTILNVTDDFKERFIEKGIELGSEAMICNIKIRDELLFSTSMYYLALDYVEEAQDLSPEDFVTFCQSKMTSGMCAKVKVKTRGQYKAALWNEMRFGRITASNSHKAAHCKTLDGALTEVIMGAGMLLKLPAVSRGKTLESKVLEIVAARLDVAIEECGVFLSPELPLFGASPNGVTKDLCFEVKCPVKNQIVENYISASEVNYVKSQIHNFSGKMF